MRFFMKMLWETRIDPFLSRILMQQVDQWEANNYLFYQTSGSVDSL